MRCLRGRVRCGVVLSMLCMFCALCMLGAAPVHAQSGATSAVRAADARAADARAADAERRLGLSLAARGQLLDAVAALERADALWRGMGQQSREVLVPLAEGYARLGFTEAATETAQRALAASGLAANALAANASPDDRASMERLLGRVRAVRGDTTAARALFATDERADRPVAAEVELQERGWRAYQRGAYREAAALFDSVVTQAQVPARVGEGLAMAAQARLEAGDAAAALAGFVAAGARARAGLAQLRSLGDSVVATTAAALVAQRALAVLEAPSAALGLLRVERSDTVGLLSARALRAVPAEEIVAAVDALGAPLTDPVTTPVTTPVTVPLARALIWTDAPRGVADSLRPAAAALSAADARVVLADARVARARYELMLAREAQRQAEAVVMGLRRNASQVADSLTQLEALLTATADALQQRDRAIADEVARYRTTLQEKIAAVRETARTNRARVDSLAPTVPAAQSTTAQLLTVEGSSAASYLSIADAAADALDSGLVRLPILFQRDSVRAQQEQLRQLVATGRTELAAARTVVDSAAARIGAASAARIAQSERALAEAELVRDSAAVVAARGADAELKARAAALAALWQRDAEAADFGAAAAHYAVAQSAAAQADTGVMATTTALARLDSALVRWPASPLRARALLLSGELLAQQAEQRYAAAQRVSGGSGGVPERPEYSAAMARLDTLLREFPQDPEADAAAYTLGTLYATAQRWDDAVRAFAGPAATPTSRYHGDALFRRGDADFEAAMQGNIGADGRPDSRTDNRRERLARAAADYAATLGAVPATADLHFLALYKLGWSEYAQATEQSSPEYQRAVDVFARLVREYDALPADQQGRLALRQEAIDYLAIALTQLGGVQDAVRYLGNLPELESRLLVLRRVARALRDQGEYRSAVVAFEALLQQSPTDARALETQGELIELFQQRMLEAARAQEARLVLVDRYAPTSPWGVANAARAPAAAIAREAALRDAAQYALAEAQKGNNSSTFLESAALFARYQREFPASAARAQMTAYEGEALFGAGRYAESGAAYERAAQDPSLATTARRNSYVAYDSALVRARDDRGAQDALFAAAQRFVAQAAVDEQQQVTIAWGRRAAESARWTVAEKVFADFAAQWPAHPFAPTARKLVGDARYRQGAYSAAQGAWREAQQLARERNQPAYVDSVIAVRVAAAARTADSLLATGGVRQIIVRQVVDSIYLPLAATIDEPTRSAEAVRDAIESWLEADSLPESRPESRLESQREAEQLMARLVRDYPTYRYATEYRGRRAQLLGALGRAEEEAAMWSGMIAELPQWSGRADAMVRRAVLLDSLGRAREAAEAYEGFAAGYPADRRAADALYNAAESWRELADSTQATRVLTAFVTRFPKDARAVRELRARAGAAAFARGMALWPRYTALTLVIGKRSQLTRSGVEAASVPKRDALRALSAAFAQAIAGGDPTWLSAATFQTGLAQWYYGLFLRDVTLPADLPEAARDAARRGSAEQAAGYFDAARATWEALVQKAGQDAFDNPWVEKARQALTGAGIPPRTPAGAP